MNLRIRPRVLVLIRFYHSYNERKTKNLNMF